jgi:hypothetical protein
MTVTQATPFATPVVATNTDFWLRFTSSAALDPGNPGRVTATVELGNAGAANATQPVRFVLIGPFFANFANPSGFEYFKRYIVQNPDPRIPEMIEFEVPAAKLASQQGIDFDVVLDVLPNGPRIFDMIWGCIETTADTETTMLNNEGIGTVGAPIAPLPTQPPGTTATNYYFVSPPPRLSAGQSDYVQIYVGNAAHTLPSSDAIFVYVSPYRVKVNRPLATLTLRATFLHNETDIGIPDLMTFPVTKLLLPPDPNLLTMVLRLSLINIPVTNHGKAHSARSGKGYLAPTGNDFDIQPGIGMSGMRMIEPI